MRIRTGDVIVLDVPGRRIDVVRQPGMDGDEAELAESAGDPLRHPEQDRRTGRRLEHDPGLVLPARLGAAELAGESIVRVDLHRERATDVEELHERDPLRPACRRERPAVRSECQVSDFFATLKVWHRRLHHVDRKSVV